MPSIYESDDWPEISNPSILNYSNSLTMLSQCKNIDCNCNETHDEDENARLSHTCNCLIHDKPLNALMEEENETFEDHPSQNDHRISIMSILPTTIEYAACICHSITNTIYILQVLNKPFFQGKNHTSIKGARTKFASICTNEYS